MNQDKKHDLTDYGTSYHIPFGSAEWESLKITRLEDGGFQRKLNKPKWLQISGEFKRTGCYVAPPIIITSDYEILDGGHRFRAAKENEIGIEVLRKPFSSKDWEAKYYFIKYQQATNVTTSHLAMIDERFKNICENIKLSTTSGAGFTSISMRRDHFLISLAVYHCKTIKRHLGVGVDSRITRYKTAVKYLEKLLQADGNDKMQELANTVSSMYERFAAKGFTRANFKLTLKTWAWLLVFFSINKTSIADIGKMGEQIKIIKGAEEDWVYRNEIVAAYNHRRRDNRLEEFPRLITIKPKMSYMEKTIHVKDSAPQRV